MSSNFDLLGNTIIYPKFNILILTKTGNRIHFNANFLKLYFISSLIISGYYGFKFLKRLPNLIWRIYTRFKPLQLKNKSLAVIFGFGDSFASIKVTKALISLGFDLILINKKDTFEHRKKYLLNKNELIEELDQNDFYVSYENIIEDPEILKKKIGNDKVDFIFDFTSFRINVNPEKIYKETQNYMKNKSDVFSRSTNDDFNKFNLNSKLFNEKDLNIENFDRKKRSEKIEDKFPDEKSLTGNNTLGNIHLIRKLNQKDLHYYNSNIFYSDEITNHIHEIILITESLIPFMQETKIIIFNYQDKSNDINHKLTVDFKNVFFNNLKNIAEKTNNFIFSTKIVNGMINYKAKQFTEQDGINIVRFSDIEDSGYFSN